MTKIHGPRPSHHLRADLLVFRPGIKLAPLAAVVSQFAPGACHQLLRIYHLLAMVAERHLRLGFVLLSEYLLQADAMWIFLREEFDRSSFSASTDLAYLLQVWCVFRRDAFHRVNHSRIQRDDGASCESGPGCLPSDDLARRE